MFLRSINRLLQPSVQVLPGSMQTLADQKKSSAQDTHLNFSDHLSCSWRIRAPSGHRVLLTFIDFDTFGFKSIIFGLCYLSDFIELYDGSDSSNSLIGRYCGPYLPASAVSTDNNMFLKFETKSIITSMTTKRRFKINYTAVQEPSIPSTVCSPYLLSVTNLDIKVNPEDHTKYIESPLYPDSYPSNIKCRWYITASRYKRINMTISEANVYNLEERSCGNSSNEKLQDLIEIRDGPSSNSTNIKTICNPLANPLRIVSTGQSLTVYFQSNDDNYFSKTTNSTARFRMEYREVNAFTDVSDCSPYKTSYENRNLKATASTTRKYIKSPLYPGKYPTGIRCTWYIKASSESKKIKLRMSNVKIYNRVPNTCSSYVLIAQDILFITDGSSIYDLKTVCSPLSSATVESTGSYMEVHFRTDADDYFVGYSAGFKLEYWEFEDNFDPTVYIIGGIIGIIGICITIYLVKTTTESHNRESQLERVPTTDPSTTTAISNPTQQIPMQVQDRAHRAHSNKQGQAKGRNTPSEQASQGPNQPNQGSDPRPRQSNRGPNQSNPGPSQSNPGPSQPNPTPSQSNSTPSQSNSTPSQAYLPPGQADPPPDYAPPDYAPPDYPPPNYAPPDYAPPGQAYPPSGQIYQPPVGYLPPVDGLIPTAPPLQYDSVVDPSQVPPEYNPQFQEASGTNPRYPTKT